MSHALITLTCGLTVLGFILLFWGAGERDSGYRNRGFAMQIVSVVLWVIAIILGSMAAYYYN